MTIEAKFQKARIYMLMRLPFWATIAMHMKYVSRPDIKNMATDGHTIFYEDSFVEKLTMLELIGVITHELAHVMHLHHIRVGSREHLRFNIAADYAINDILLKGDLILPADRLHDLQYENMTAEEIYNKLPSMELLQMKNILSEKGLGDVEYDPQSVANIEEEKQRVKEMVAQAAMVAQKAGKLSDNLKRYVEELLEPVVDWREVLARFLTNIDQSDYNWTHPNKRYAHFGFIMPSLYNLTLGDIWCFVDTSGSIDQKALADFSAETTNIMSQFNKPLEVLYIDTRVQHHQTLLPDENETMQAIGGGGTCFRPGFEHLEEESIQPTAVVYLTDGYCDTFPNEPDYPVLWCIYGNNKQFKPPFGEVIHM